MYRSRYAEKFGNKAELKWQGKLEVADYPGHSRAPFTA